jgi:hypothetical protein
MMNRPISSHSDNNDTMPSVQVTATATTTAENLMKNRKRSLSSFSSPPFLNRDSDDDENSSHGHHGADSDISQNVTTHQNASLIDSLENDDDTEDDGHDHDIPAATTVEGKLIANQTRRQTFAGTVSSSTSWKDFCRQGKKFKSLLDDALVKVATATNATAGTQQGNKPGSSSLANDSSNIDSSIVMAMSSHSLLQKLAQEKQTENMHLQNRLEQEQTERATLQALLDDLRSTKEQQTSQITRLTSALKQAAHKATQAQ